MLLVLVAQKGSITTKFCTFVPRPCSICFYILLCSKRKKQTNAELFPQGFNNSWEDLDYCWLGLSVWCGLEEMNPSSGRGRGSGSLLALGCRRG